MLYVYFGKQIFFLKNQNFFLKKKKKKKGSRQGKTLSPQDPTNKTPTTPKRKRGKRK